ncbi:hypothetical protein [Neobacillus sp. OS1-33]|uniref:hypothetical protein n=1 Tax=Neobacillus sp. OS1-33 TaxID=3070683 RepID=UPI0027DF77D7|nr:hypothetical protein [Neobacillus sp. OS1-33]WML27350.1 hypothetical protein RCG22_06945 [Neobacillus sp. OS1-33]
MERYCIKGAIYGLLISFALSIWFVPYKSIEYDGDTLITEVINTTEYVVRILRYSVLGSVIGAALVYIQKKFK